MTAIGIALGSGAARGWAHIGVLEALDDEGIHPQFIVGSSIGALVGAAYAAGKLAELKEAALKINLPKVIYYFAQTSIPRSGLIDGARVVKFIRKSLGVETFDDLKIPMRIIASNILTGAEVILSSGNLVEAIRASISIPGVFSPAYCQEQVLVDGGIINPLPVEHVRSMGAEKVVAVDINYIPPYGEERGEEAEEEEKGKRGFPALVMEIPRKLAQLTPKGLGIWSQWTSSGEIPNIFDVISHSARITQEQITNARLLVYPPDVLIRPVLPDILLFEFNKAEESIQCGYRMVKEMAAAGQLDILRG